MSRLIIDIEQLRGRKRAIKPQPVPTAITEVRQPDPVEVVAPVVSARVSVSGRSTELEAAIDRLAAKNPALIELMNSLELEAVGLVSLPGSARLWELSGQALEPGKTYTKVEAVEHIRQAAVISTERAERGFTMMLETKAIESTGYPDHYYLGGSTPF